jgi:phospholipase C
VASSSGYDERSARSVSLGQGLVRTMITQLMLSRYWGSSAFMWSYDGPGGWYDGVRPPQMGSATVGFRVPALLVSAYSRQGQVNHTVMDYTGALKFIEQNWRLDPLADRDARSNSIISAFDFAAGPRPPVLLRAGAAPDPLPVTHPLSQRQVTVIYLLYGGAAAVSILLVAFAAFSSARRRRSAPASRAAAAKETGG